MKKKGNEGTLRRQRLRDVYCEHEIDRMKCSDQIGGKTCRQILLVLTTLREPRFSTNCERRELANSSHNRFSARAKPPGGGGQVAGSATRRGQLCTLYDPPGGPGRGGLAPSENYGEPAAPIKVF
jgi:hypothetical protein